MNHKIHPVTVAEYHAMDVDFGNHLDHGVEDYWASVLPYAATVGLFIDDVCVFILGMIPDGTGICTMFVISSRAVQTMQVQRLLVQYADTGLGILQRLYSPHRVQCIVNPENPQHVSFIKHHGFEYEGTMNFYTPSGQAADLYARRGFV